MSSIVEDDVIQIFKNIKTPKTAKNTITDIINFKKECAKSGTTEEALAIAEKIGFIQNARGAICGPMDSFLTLRGIKKLHLRMKTRQRSNLQIQ